VGKQGDRAAATAAVERWRQQQHDKGSGSGVAALAERQRQRSSSAVMVGNLAAVSAAQERWRQCSRGIGCGENHEFFYPWGRERVQIPKGRAYVKKLYQAYDLLKNNKSAHLSTCRQISNLLNFPAKTKNQQMSRQADSRFHFPGHSI
jgi:hypothetical protein